MEPLQGHPVQGHNPYLKFLLFVDNRSRTIEQLQEVRKTLESLTQDYGFSLEVINVSDQPHLTEYFKLIATPALIRLHPPPRQILAGTNLPAQIQNWWPRWRILVEESLERSFNPNGNPSNPHSEASSFSYGSDNVLIDASILAEFPSSIDSSAEILRLSDRVFELEREKADLAAQVHFKDRIIAILAHDLRNPLTAASLAIDTLALSLTPEDNRSACLTPELLQQLLQQARTQLRRIDRMVTDILHAAKGSQSELLIQPHKLELSHLCREAIDQVRDRWCRKNQTLETDIPTDLPAVYADRDRIHQVVINLLDNAIKYTPDQGKIQLSILHRTMQKVQISICDTGPGIPEEKREQIFEDSFRLQRDEQEDGYGIGLAVCQRIIRAHYGQIWVDSVPHQGSCFHFTLPVYPY